MAAGGKIMVLLLNRAHKHMRVVHTITTAQRADRVLLHMVVAPVMMPATIGVREEEEVRVDLDKAALQEAPVVLVLVTILELEAIRHTVKGAMVVAMEMVRFPDHLEQPIPVTEGMVVLIQRAVPL